MKAANVILGVAHAADARLSGEVTPFPNPGTRPGERRSWKLDPLDPGVDIMITPTSSEARELIGLAERMGIPTEDAVHSVLQHLTHKRRVRGLHRPAKTLSDERAT